MPADGTSAAAEGNGDFGRSPIFGQLSDKLLLCPLRLYGGTGREAQERVGNLGATLGPNPENKVVTRAQDGIF